MGYLKYMAYIAPALTFIRDITTAAKDGNITGAELFYAAKKVCKTIGIDLKNG